MNFMGVGNKAASGCGLRGMSSIRLRALRFEIEIKTHLPHHAGPEVSPSENIL
jgi:hypothetical protein